MGPVSSTLFFSFFMISNPSFSPLLFQLCFSPLAAEDRALQGCNPSAGRKGLSAGGSGPRPLSQLPACVSPLQGDKSYPRLAEARTRSARRRLAPSRLGFALRPTRVRFGLPVCFGCAPSQARATTFYPGRVGLVPHMRHTRLPRGAQTGWPQTPSLTTVVRTATQGRVGLRRNPTLTPVDTSSPLPGRRQR